MNDTILWNFICLSGSKDGHQREASGINRRNPIKITIRNYIFNFFFHAFCSFLRNSFMYYVYLIFIFKYILSYSFFHRALSLFSKTYKTPILSYEKNWIEKKLMKPQSYKKELLATKKS